jgi:3-methyladenine DNA glycosylase AlkD
MAVNPQDVLSKLEALGDERVRAQNRRNGAGENQFGVRLGDIRKVARSLRADHALGLALWDTGNLDARLVAILSFNPAKLTGDELEELVRSARSAQLADWLNAYVVRKHPGKEALRQKWMTDSDPWAARAGWDLTSERIGRSPVGLDLPALLDRIEAEMGGADPAVQWTMNFCLAGIGIHFPEHRPRALAIGEALGIYRGYPVSRGCTSPFAPIWIQEMVRRQG